MIRGDVLRPTEICRPRYGQVALNHFRCTPFDSVEPRATTNSNTFPGKQMTVSSGSHTLAYCREIVRGVDTYGIKITPTCVGARSRVGGCQSFDIGFRTEYWGTFRMGNVFCSSKQIPPTEKRSKTRPPFRVSIPK